MRPVMEGLIRFESLKGYDLNLDDIALLNEALDIRSENARRIDASWRR